MTEMTTGCMRHPTRYEHGCAVCDDRRPLPKASAECPWCGADGPHTHTRGELAAYAVAFAISVEYPTRAADPAAGRAAFRRKPANVQREILADADLILARVARLLGGISE